MEDDESWFGAQATASTGPRLLGRGDRVTGQKMGCASRRFNGAAPFRARRCAREGPAHVGGGRASTGPRLLGRGDRIQITDELGQMMASTGPRLLGRGDPRTSRGGSFRITRFNGAAPFRARRCPRRTPRSPRASRFNGAAPFRARRSQRPARRDGHVAGFNGAAPFRARRLSRTRSWTRTPSKLQRGRAF